VSLKYSYVGEMIGSVYVVQVNGSVSQACCVELLATLILSGSLRRHVQSVISTDITAKLTIQLSVMICMHLLLLLSALMCFYIMVAVQWWL